MQHLTCKHQFQFYFGLRLAVCSIVQQLLKLLFVLDVQSIECPIDGFEKGSLTTTVITTYQYNRTFIFHLQIQVQTQIGLEVCCLYSLYLHSL